MIRDLRIALIGAGVMGEAMIGGLLKQELVPPEQIIATEPREGRRAEIAQRYGVRVTEDNIEAAHTARRIACTFLRSSAWSPRTLSPRARPFAGGLGPVRDCPSLVAPLPPSVALPPFAPGDPQAATSWKERGTGLTAADQGDTRIRS